MPTFTETKRRGYNLQRSASNGAAITLVAGCGEYTALFECANYCAEVLGNREWKDLADGIMEVVPHYKIPLEELYPSLQKLSQRFSIALVEYTQTKNGGQFVCLWRINPSKPTPPSTNPDDY